MPDQPDVANEEAGTRQPSNRIGTEFHLNDAFVEAVGRDKAQALLDLLDGMVAEHGGADLDAIRDRLGQGLDAIGVQMSDVELASFADQIARSEQAVRPGQDNPNENPGVR